MPPSLGNACLGVVIEGAVGGRAAAVKLVDLWRGPEGKEALQVRCLVQGRFTGGWPRAGRRLGRRNLSACAATPPFLRSSA
eukprot:XP_001700419.1 predicted protein [Chlamydomonas reinhardtii]